MHLGTYLMNAMLLKTSKVGSIIFNLIKNVKTHLSFTEELVAVFNNLK